MPASISHQQQQKGQQPAPAQHKPWLLPRVVSVNTADCAAIVAGAMQCSREHVGVQQAMRNLFQGLRNMNIIATALLHGIQQAAAVAAAAAAAAAALPMQSFGKNGT
jgi:hypothetical protein